MLNVERFINHLQRMIDKPFEKKFLLAVSGGMDSCVLAYLFHWHNLHFDVAHCNFHLRGEDSNLDMEFVKNIPYFADKMIFIKEFDTFLLQKDSGKSIEMVARDLRYQWFAEFEEEYDFIVTAHHADDNAETLLLNLTRGTGLKGLKGIPPINGKIIRPLLSFSVLEIKKFAERHKISYRTDITNYDETFYRNKIRQQIIPKLQKLNPNLIQTFAKNITIFNAQFSFLEQQIEKYKNEILQKKKQKWYINIEKLQKEEHALLLLYEILSDFGFSASTIENIFNGLNGIVGKIFYSSSHQLLIDREELIIISREKKENIEVQIASMQELISLGFEISFLPCGTVVDLKSLSPNSIFISKNKLTFPLTYRYWRHGDFFYPYGRKGKKKVSDLFIEKKIDTWQKQEIPILCCGEDIVWIVGIAADRRFGVEDMQQEDFYRISYSVEIP